MSPRAGKEIEHRSVDFGNEKNLIFEEENMERKRVNTESS